MTQDEHILYKALMTRDKSYDGLFYFGVTSTGIYCRPICPAVKPKPENVLFFPSFSAAEEAGFRACKRCRPETRPGSPAWHLTEASVTRALRYIAAGALDTGTVESLADKVGLSERHLRRLFQTHLGLSPIDAAEKRRHELAKQLLVASPDPIAAIAFAAGYQSLRRFNECFKKQTGQSPTTYRKTNDRP